MGIHFYDLTGYKMAFNTTIYTPTTNVFRSIEDKGIDSFWPKSVEDQNFAISKGRLKDDDKGMKTNVFGGIMSFVISIVVILRLSRNIPRKPSEAALYGDQVCSPEPMSKARMTEQSQPRPMTSYDYIDVKKRMAKLEEKVSFLMWKPATMPRDKEEMLNDALNRVGVLEEELSAAKKALQDALDTQQELQTYIDNKKKRKKRKCVSCLSSFPIYFFFLVSTQIHSVGKLNPDVGKQMAMMILTHTPRMNSIVIMI
ncbi:hypothetical protein GQ457_10G021580 [Hibiscus cannabinus]